MAYFGAAVLVSEITPARLEEFARAEVARGASLPYVSRNLSVIAAGLSRPISKPLCADMSRL